uniref:Uncharacterized protein n=1 Tax=Timema poppense TaxID=170557 RepID=A0A7R9GXH5_TIMPO|nr:unnamed protein product [Timema poppensis]
MGTDLNTTSQTTWAYPQDLSTPFALFPPSTHRRSPYQDFNPELPSTRSLIDSEYNILLTLRAPKRIKFVLRQEVTFDQYGLALATTHRPPLANKLSTSPGVIKKVEFKASVPEFSWRKSGKPFRNKPSSIAYTKQGFEPQYPLVIDSKSIFHCDSDALDHTTTQAGMRTLFHLLVRFSRRELCVMEAIL